MASNRFLTDITVDGKAGIGTSSPGAPLDVKSNSASSADSGIRLIATGSSDVIAAIGEKSTNGGRFHLYDGGTAKVSFYSDGTANYIAAGNVGIGTTSPQKKLDVYLGTNNAVASIGGGISAGEYAGLHFGYLETGNSNYRHSAIVFERDDASFGDARGNIHILNSASGSASADLGDARLTILPSGNVGIGTTSPAEKLDVAGTARMDVGVTEGVHYAGTGFQHWGDGGTGVDFPANDTIDLLTSSSSRVRIDASGNVGIGTTSPAQKLHVSGGHLQLDDTYKIQWGGTDARIDGSNASNYLRFFTADTERMRIISSGNVGIGTSSPSQKLHVAGAVTIDNFGLLTNWTSSNTDIDGLIDGSAFGGLLQGPSSGHFVLGLKDNDVSDSFAVMSGSGNFTTDSTYDKLCFRVKASGDVHVGGRLTISTRDNNTSSTTALVINGSEVEQRTLGSLAFLNGVTVTWDDLTGDQSNINISGFNNDSGYLTSSNGMTTTGGTITSGNLTLNDNVQLRIGTGHDLRLLHNGTDSLINSNGSGDLYIQQFNDDKDIIFKNDDGSGGITEYLVMDGSVGFTKAHKKIRFLDSVDASFGNSDDLRVLHDGNNGVIVNSTGTLYIRNDADDEDIIFQTDDGSGSRTQYLVMDGSTTENVFYKNVALRDDVQATFGNANDLRIYHSSDNSYVDNYTGDLYIRNTVDDRDIIFQADDGSGGNAQYIRIDGSATLTQFDKNTKHADSVLAGFGNGNDLQIYHDGTNSVLNNIVGNLQIYQQADDADIQFICDDGSGGVTEYFRVDGAADRTIFSRSTRHSDGVVANFGTSEDLQIYHDGSNSYIENATGNLFIRNNADDADITFQCDAGNGAVTEYFRLDGSAVNINFAATALFRDNVKAVFGTSSDLQIYHSGSHSYILDDGTGELRINSGNAIRFRKHDNETMALFTANGACELYHDNSKRFETTASGVALTDHLVLENNKEIRQKDSGGTERTVFELDSSNDLNIGGSYAGALKFIGGGSYTEQMRIHDDGNVGVGTASPEARLHVYNGDAGATTANVSHDDLIVENSGNVGIQLFGPATSYQYIAFGDPGSANAGYVRYDHNNNEMRFRVNGSDKVTFNSSGYVGINTTSPTEELTVNGDANITGSFAVGISNAHASFNFYNQGTAYFNGNVTVDANLSLGDSDTIYLGAGNDLQIYHDGSNSFIADTGTGKLKVLASQFDIINAANTEFMAEFKENAEVALYYNNSKKFETTSAGITVTGAITATGDITAFSDERLKEDIKPLEDSLEKVQAIEGVSFVKKNDEDKKQNIGFIAQQLKEVLPEVVHENEDGIHSVAYGNITALLVEAVKEQQEIIAQLEERIIDLENRL